MPTPSEWIVYGTAVIGTSILVYHRITGKLGLIRKPTKKEWNKAYYAPEDEYPWDGGDDRVETDDDKTDD